MPPGIATTAGGTQENGIGMKRSKRSMHGRRALTPLSFAKTWPAAGLALLGLGGQAQAQSSRPASENKETAAAIAAPAVTAAQNDTSALDSDVVNAAAGQAASATDAAPGQTAPATQTPKPAAPPVVPPPAAPYNGPVITDIVVIGAKTLNKAYIISASGHNVGDPFTEDVLSDMKTRLTATGYFGGHSVTIEESVKVESIEANGKRQVVITVDENDTITGINLTGAGPVKVEDVLALIHIKPGKAYNEKIFQLDAFDILEFYRKKGFITTLADATIDNKGVLNISIVVTRVAEIKINGNHKTRRNVILRAINTKSGDYLNIYTLERDRVNLINLDLFEPGSVNPTDYSLGAGRVGITINVVEKRTGTVTAGAGYSNRAQIIGFAEIVESNFRGMGEQVSVRGEIGGVAGRPSIETSFTEPYLDRKKTALNLQLYDKTVYRFSNNLSNSVATQSTSGNSRYNEQRLGGTTTVSRPFLQTFRGALSFRGEDVRTDPLDLSVQNAQIIQNGPIFVLGGSLLHNTRDLDIDPVSGGFQTFNLQVGHANLHSPKTFTGILIPGVTGNVNFSKGFAEARQYYSLSGPRKRGKPDEDKTTIATRFQFGGSAGTLPFFEQFFVGGGENLRGYRDDRFWGSNLFLASAEFRQPIARKLKGVLFADLGDAWGGSYSNVNIPGFTQDSFHPHLGVGLGVRVNTPIGPLRLDYGIGDEGGRTHFSIGPTF